MVTKANDRRVKASLERTRLALKTEQLEIEKRRREQSREREQALPMLRLLCGLYGDNDWPDETPLAEILEHHLAVPLGVHMNEIRGYVAELQKNLGVSRRKSRASTTPSPDTAAAQRPTPIRPTVVPQPEHRCIVVASELRGQRGYRATCICNWRSPHEATESMATLDAERHARREGDEAMLRQGVR
jgi:hypothetical protein